MAYCTFEDVYQIVKNDLGISETDEAYTELQEIIISAIESATLKIDLQIAGIKKTDADNQVLKHVCKYYAASEVLLAYYSGGTLGDTYNKPIHYEKKADEMLKAFINSKMGVSAVISEDGKESKPTIISTLDYAMTED